ncbi:MAG: deoxyribodipyrimidine photo-lyase [Victivallales bacterium]|nr:deoxyribodipyrimidine photo-lyase [Victivallales bacterium]
MIQSARIRVLKNMPLQHGAYVLYWMQAAQRVDCNHALEFALRQANERKLPLAVYFGITASYPEANIRHYRFMFEGLRQTAANLRKRGINFIVRKESPEKGVVKLAENAALTVFDAAYMPIQKRWRQSAAAAINGSVIQVESDVIVPLATASNKEEYAARTIRGKINRQLAYFMQPPESHDLSAQTDIGLESAAAELENPESLLSSMNIDKTVHSCEQFHPGGVNEAEKRLQNFISSKLEKYPEMRNDPAADFQSGLSPYLHFGQISPLQIALAVKNSGSRGAEAFLEELIVRRELAANFAYYNGFCRDYRALPSWAQATLAEHEQDQRQYLYSPEELENAATDDPYWNAAQNEMRICGKMHGYMRMYWGKMLLQWTKTPLIAFKYAQYLNNKYELDGRGPNSCAGIAWCFGKHDRPWPEHRIVGKVRLMNQNGLKRKFDADAYVAKINALTANIKNS